MILSSQFALNFLLLIFSTQKYTKIAYIVNTLEYSVSDACYKTLSHVLTVQSVLARERVPHKCETCHSVDPDYNQTQNSHPDK